MERIADVEKVLMNEIDNLHGVYLYLEGDSWCIRRCRLEVQH